MKHSLKTRDADSIHDFFMDAARHFVRNSKSLQHEFIRIEPDLSNAPKIKCYFSYGDFCLRYVGEKDYNEEQYVFFIVGDHVSCKWTSQNKDWFHINETDILFECAQEFMQICNKLRNKEIEPFPDKDETKE